MQASSSRDKSDLATSLSCF